MITTASDYKKEVHEEVMLTNGNTFLMREPPLRAIIKYLRAIGVEVQPGQEKQTLDTTLTKMQDFNDVLASAIVYLIPVSVVSPKIVVENPKEDELTIDDIKKDDILIIVAWIMNKLKMSETGNSEVGELPTPQ